MSIKEELALLDKEKEAFMKSYWVRRQTIQRQCNHEHTMWSSNYIEVNYDYEYYFTNTCVECGHSYEVEFGDSGYHDLLEKYFNGDLE